MIFEEYTPKFARIRTKDFRDYIKEHEKVHRTDVYNHLYSDDRHHYLGKRPNVESRSYRNQTLLACQKMSRDEIVREGVYFRYVGKSNSQPSTPTLTNPLSSVNTDITPIGETTTNSETLPPPADWDGKILTDLGNLTAPIKEEESQFHDIHINLDIGDKIIFFGDSHFGSYFSSYHRTKIFVDQVRADPKLKVVTMGDLRNTTGNILAPGNSFSEAMGTQIELRALECFLEGIADSHLVYLPGNHEHRDEKAIGYSPDEMMYNKYVLGTDKGQKMVHYKRMYVHVGEKTYYFFLMHKLPGFSMYNPCHGATRLLTATPILDSNVADVIVGAHTHRSAIQTYDFGGKERILVMGGSFLEFCNFAKQISASYRGSGLPMIAITPSNNLVSFRNYERGLEVF